MSRCVCGKPVEQEGTRCPRCAALQILGLAGNPSRETIDESYRILASAWSPERYANDFVMQRAAEVKLKTIRASYDLLITGRSSSSAFAPRFAAYEEDGEESTRRRRPGLLKRAFFHRFVQRGLRFAVLASLLGALALATDFALSAIPATAPGYLTFKTNMKNLMEARVEGGKQMLSAHNADAADTEKTTPEAQPIAAATPHVKNAATKPRIAPAADDGETSHDLALVPHVSGAQSYVTLGISASEVMHVLGPPTATSGSALRYGKSSIYLSDGQVIGWDLDPDAPPLRVKLWPHHAVDPGEESFTTGSSRDEVIAVQGTPTSLSGNKFGYGRSYVYFESGHVVGWMNNPQSVPLRVHDN